MRPGKIKQATLQEKRSKTMHKLHKFVSAFTLSAATMAVVLSSALFAFFATPSRAMAYDLLGQDKMVHVCNKQVYVGASYSWATVVPQSDLSSLRVTAWMCDGVGPVMAESGEYYCNSIGQGYLKVVWENRPWWQRWMGKKFVGYTCSW